MTYTAAGQGYVNAEVMKHIDEVQIFEMNKMLQKAIASRTTRKKCRRWPRRSRRRAN